MLVVGLGSVLSTYAGDRSTCTGSLMREANTVAVYDSGPSVRDRSNDALRPRSASTAPRTSRRVRPAASVSSVIGVGPKKPVPIESLLVQRPARTSADRRGLKNVPYSLWASTRALADRERYRDAVMSYCANAPGTVKV